MRACAENPTWTKSVSLLIPFPRFRNSENVEVSPLRIFHDIACTGPTGRFYSTTAFLLKSKKRTCPVPSLYLLERVIQREEVAAKPPNDACFAILH
jgi:hypothetical protein